MLQYHIGRQAASYIAGCFWTSSLSETIIFSSWKLKSHICIVGSLNYQLSTTNNHKHFFRSNVHFTLPGFRHSFQVHNVKLPLIQILETHLHLYTHKHSELGFHSWKPAKNPTSGGGGMIGGFWGRLPWGWATAQSIQNNHMKGHKSLLRLTFHETEIKWRLRESWPTLQQFNTRYRYRWNPYMHAPS